MSELRCAWCHASLLESSPRSCRCGTLLHEECARDAGSCPTLGCAGWARVLAPSPDQGSFVVRFLLPFSLASVFVVGVLLCSLLVALDSMSPASNAARLAERVQDPAHLVMQCRALMLATPAGVTTLVAPQDVPEQLRGLGEVCVSREAVSTYQGTSFSDGWGLIVAAEGVDPRQDPYRRREGHALRPVAPGVWTWETTH